jgi:hypothetical protein
MFAAHGSDVVQLASFIGVKFKLTGILKLVKRACKKIPSPWHAKVFSEEFLKFSVHFRRHF